MIDDFEREKLVLVAALKSEKEIRDCGWRDRCRSILKRLRYLEDPFGCHAYCGDDRNGRSAINSRVFGRQEFPGSSEFHAEIIHTVTIPPSEVDLKIKREKDRERAREAYQRKKSERELREFRELQNKRARKIKIKSDQLTEVGGRIQSWLDDARPFAPVKSAIHYQGNTLKKLTPWESWAMTEEEYKKACG